MPDHPLPPIVYLPSSGGYTSSRVTPETPDRQRFPFRRYSIDDDGKLVCKTRNVARDTGRPKPYDRPHSKPTSHPPRRSLSPPTTGDSNESSGSDAAAQLITSLVPMIMRDPKTLESSVSSICASHNVDSAIVSSLIRAVKKQLDPSGDEMLDESTQPAVQPEASTSISKATDTRTSPSVRDGLIPFKHDRPFASGARGTTTWYSTESPGQVPFPPSGLRVEAGELYIHKNLSSGLFQVWLYHIDGHWRHVNIDGPKVFHPVHSERSLNLRSDGTPSWVTTVRFATGHNRKDKNRV